MDPHDDKDLRIRTGAQLLRRIKEYGGTAAEVAGFLGISATVPSHWQSGDPDRLKRVGAPTNQQLQKMVGFLCAKIKSNQENIVDMVIGGVVRHREQMMLLQSLAPAISTMNDEWTSAVRTKTEQIDSFISRLRAYHESNGMDVQPEVYQDELLRFLSHMESLPTQEDLSLGIVAWDYDNLRRHMIGFHDGVRSIELIVEQLLEKKDENKT